VAADIRFHNLLAEMSGNPILQAVSEALLQWLFEFHSELVRFPGHEDVTLADHQEIYERVAERDAEGAERAMIDHLTRVNVQGRRRSRTKTRRLNGTVTEPVSRKQGRKL
jgi:DNA-binding FadR family transcriptional regulator